MSYSNHFVSLVAHFFSLSLSLSRITRVNIGRVCIQGASAYRVSLHVTLESVFAAITLAKCWITDAIHFSKGNLFSPFRNSFFFFFSFKGERSGRMDQSRYAGYPRDYLALSFFIPATTAATVLPLFFFSI